RSGRGAPREPPCRPHAAGFFLDSPGAPRHLPPFPTRRSSDLVHAPGRTVDSSHKMAVQARQGQIPFHTDKQAVVAAVMVQVFVKDRKSTRLNSSHVSISYAVFCLKKKTRCRGGTRHTCYAKTG